MKIALAHDSFTQLGGAERVVDALHELFPHAPVFTLVFDPQLGKKYKDWEIRTSGLQTLYLTLGRLQYLLPLIPWGVDNLDLSGFDLILSSSSAWMKNINVPKNCVHINYCHTPARFLWSDDDYLKQEARWYQRPFASYIIKRMKRWDYQGAQRVTKFLANSKEVQARIKKYYNRDSEVIYPFVDTNFWSPVQSSPAFQRGASRGYFLLAGRLHAHKKVDLIVEIFNELNVPLHIVGTGRYEGHLRAVAKPNIKFFGRVTDEELREQYRQAKAFIYPQIEDFGLMPLEAAACGTPTLAYGQGGALETIIAGKTGEFFDSYDKEKIKQIILNWDLSKYATENLVNRAKEFSKEKFKENILAFINENRH